MLASLLVVLAAPIVVLAAPDRAAAQQPAEGGPPTEEAEPPPVTISPRGAFLRALAVPGWGHTAIGAHTRGGFYFTLQAATAYTLIRSRMRLGEARERVAFREGFLRSQLAAEGVTDPTEVDGRLDGDPALRELRSLEDSRADQQEDMVALGIFLLFLSGADAYVSAHLSRFPDPIEVEARPAGGGRVDVGLRLRVR